MKSNGTEIVQRPELDAVIQAAVDAGVLGIQIRVRDTQGEWIGTAGARDLGAAQPPDSDDRFWIGSTSKPFTAVTVLKLVDEGLIGLDDPVSHHVIDLGIDSRITIRMLLTHRSGLYNYTGEPDGTGAFGRGIPAIGKAWAEDRFHEYDVEDLVRFALAQPANFEPGTEQSYGNTNYSLLALLSERVTGRGRAEELERLVFAPLGLRSTVVPRPDQADLPTPHSHGYFRYRDGEEWKVVDVTRQNPSLLIGAGDLISTTADLQAFMSGLLGGRLISNELLGVMLTPAGNLGIGAGMWVQDLGPDVSIVHHNGGAPGGYGSLMIASPDGGRILTAGMTTGDADIDIAVVYPQVLGALIMAVFAAA